MTPLFVGGLLCSHFEGRAKSKDAAAEQRKRGILPGSGFVGGEGLLGVVIAALAFVQNRKPDCIGRVWLGVPWLARARGPILFGILIGGFVRTVCRQDIECRLTTDGFCGRSRTMRVLLVCLLLTLAGCATTRPQLPYPAFVQADELPDVFLAALPGVRAKQFAGNPQTRRSSNRIVLPAQWSGSSGAAPGKSLEIFVLFGEMSVGNLTLSPGGYAWFPPGFSGANLSTVYGAEILYFLDDANPQSQFRSPIIYSSEIVDWQAISNAAEQKGMMIKEMRHDPGSGARTWLLQVSPEARTPWQSRDRVLEGYLISGRYQGSECAAGESVNAVYTEGGYFHRPANTVHGGPDERALETSVWLLRVQGDSQPLVAGACTAP